MPIGYKSIQVYATLSRVSFSGIPFTQYRILFHPCRKVPLKKGNFQMDSSVQDNPAAPSPCQYGKLRVVPCPPSLKYQVASRQARLKSSWALHPWGGFTPHCKENPIYVFLFWELRGLSPNFHIYVSVSDLYIPRIGPHISSSRIGRPILEIYKSLTDMYMSVGTGRQNIIILFWR